jgi:hypothetical protein
MKRRLIAILIATLVLTVVVAVVAVPLFISLHDTHASSVQQNQNAAAMTTINTLVHSSVVGSTQLILDKKGHTTMVDAYPSDVQIVPSNPATLLTNAPSGSLHAGDLVAINSGRDGRSNTLVAFPARVGPGHQFNASNFAVSGLAKEAFNTKTGTDWVTNFKKNAVEIFNPDGTHLTTVTSAHFQKPWGIAFNGGLVNAQESSIGSFFVANAWDATIDRIDIIPVNGSATFEVSRIARLDTNGDEAKIALTWAPTLTINKKHYTDVLLALNPAKNSIVAFPNSTTTAVYPDQGITVFQGKPLNNPGGIAINPFNNDLFVVNLNDNNLLELNANDGTVVGTRLVDNVPVNLQNGYGSALFGVAAGKDAAGNLVIYFTDDNTNTVNMLGI